MWANTAEAYRRLHPALRALAGELRAVHTNLYDYAAERPQIGGVDVREPAGPGAARGGPRTDPAPPPGPPPARPSP